MVFRFRRVVVFSVECRRADTYFFFVKLLDDTHEPKKNGSPNLKSPISQLSIIKPVLMLSR
jgi:hypothetical protein